MYRLTPDSVKKIVYSCCEKNHIEHSFNESYQQAGKKWLELLFNSHPELS